MLQQSASCRSFVRDCRALGREGISGVAASRSVAPENAEGLSSRCTLRAHTAVTMLGKDRPAAGNRACSEQLSCCNALLGGATELRHHWLQRRASEAEAALQKQWRELTARYEEQLRLVEVDANAQLQAAAERADVADRTAAEREQEAAAAHARERQAAEAAQVLKYPFWVLALGFRHKRLVSACSAQPDARAMHWLSPCP